MIDNADIFHQCHFLPSYSTVCSHFCFVVLLQSLQHKLADRSPHKQKLSRLSLELVACLPPHSVSSDEISNRFDQVEILWTNLSMYLSTSKVNLELAVPLARSYEKEKNRLDFWVKKAVSDIKGYSSLPSDPHAVQHTKQMVDVSMNTSEVVSTLYASRDRLLHTYILVHFLLQIIADHLSRAIVQT